MTVSALIVLTVISAAVVSKAGSAQDVQLSHTHDCDVCEAVAMQLEAALSRELEARAHRPLTETALLDYFDGFCQDANPAFQQYGLTQVAGIPLFTGPGLPGFNASTTFITEDTQLQVLLIAPVHVPCHHLPSFLAPCPCPAVSPSPTCAPADATATEATAPCHAAAVVVAAVVVIVVAWSPVPGHARVALSAAPALSAVSAAVVRTGRCAEGGSTPITPCTSTTVINTDNSYCRRDWGLHRPHTLGPEHSTPPSPPQPQPQPQVPEQARANAAEHERLLRQQREVEMEERRRQQEQQEQQQQQQQRKQRPVQIPQHVLRRMQGGEL
ncbi:hypothetical protein PTSG_02925 [Salpingoeca rosetta]|uniref:DUF3456 domain-containing protein n=1 Tax=Salpingoeca rosetta (strain ATCC 50818 / BSB-021) TaxID=946362 RepID=F2U3R1_SALR5|nr:uncharacterized protein PTSG_02925 [Salpingoeca rosetta]EGD82255.1 hypothetical protein PTSG_02925 [Salpingoeca rosetta]|eukprot:XP_004996438.1 hypothetical protein PTSG_02925 [Salpingoeca rosetta]